MAPWRVVDSCKAVAWAVLVASVLLAVAGCPKPQKLPEIEKPKEIPLLYRKLTSGNQKDTLDYARSVLSEFRVNCDPTLQLKEATDCLLPNYGHMINVMFLAGDRDGKAFLRAVADAASITSSEARSVLLEVGQEQEIIPFIRNVFLLHELGIYLHHQYKIYNHVNPFKEEEFAQEFARVLIDHFVAEEPAIKPLHESLVAFYDKLLVNVPKDFPGLSQDQASLKEWYNKSYPNLISANQRSHFLFKMLRQLTHFKKEQVRTLPEFVEEHISKPGERARLNIKTADKSLSAYTIYQDRKRVLKRIGHSFKFRGLSGIAVGSKNRVFFSDYRNIQQITDHGSRDVVEGTQGIFGPTGFVTNAQDKFFFVDRDIVRAIDLADRDVLNIKLSGKLEGSAAADPHGITPVAATPDGGVLVVNNSTRTLYILGSDGSLTNSAPLRGITGGIAYHEGNVYVTNTSHHTVDRVDFGIGASTIAGVRDFPGHGDGKGFDVFFNSPTGICVNEDGNIFVADTLNHAIRKIDMEGAVSTVIGIARGSADGPVETAGLHCPIGVAAGSNGSLFVAELAAERVVAISSAKPSHESKPMPATGVSGTDNPDREISELSKSIERSALGYRLFDTYVKRGIRYRTIGEYEKSSADLETAIRIAPDKVSARVEAGITQEAADQVDKAINTYTLAINMKENLVPVELFRNHDFLRALMQRGLAYARQDNFTSAIEDLTKVVETRKMAVEIYKEPDLPNETIVRIWLTRGKIYLDSGDDEKAVADFDQAIAQNPRKTQAYYYRGLAYKSAQKYELAVKDLTKAAALGSSYADPHYVLGQIYQSNIVDNQKAIQHLKTYLALNGPNKTDAEARIEELKKKLDRTTTTEGAFWEEVVEDRDGRRWIIRHYADGKTQKFPVKEEKEK